MSLITFLEPDAIAIEKDFKDHWRVHNGEQFVNGFKTKEAAREFGTRNQGVAIALCTLEDGTYVYTKRELL